jgi:MOSC domain-containing protein YiiM
MSDAARVISLNASVPGSLAWRGHEVRTGIFKQAVAGRRRAGKRGLEGDFIADLRVHGGPDKAVYAYPSEHYAYWREQYPGLELSWGAFGENLTSSGLVETDVHVGDRFRVGGAELEISQFRIPCFKLGRKLGQSGLVKRFLASGRCGWYWRVLAEGEIGAGDHMELLSPDRAGFSIAELIALYRDPDFDRARVAVAASLAALSEPWRNELAARVMRETSQQTGTGEEERT